MEIDLGNFYLSLGIVAIIIVLGFILGKCKLVDKNTNKHLVNLLLTVFMPASLFNAFPSEYSDKYAGLFFMGLLGGFVVMILVILAAKLVYNKKFFGKDLSTEAQFAFDFNNATFLGYPVILTAFGEQGVVPYCGFIIAFNIALFSYGVWLFKKKISKKFFIDCITNPNIIAVVLGMILFLARINLPSIITSSVGYVAGATTPLSLICIGFMLSEADLKKVIKKWKMFLAAAIQLLLAPFITWAVTSLLQFPTEVIVICTLIQALPSATSLGLFAEKYGGNVTEASEMVVTSTLMSIVTLPVVMGLLSIVI